MCIRVYMYIGVDSPLSTTFATARRTIQGSFWHCGEFYVDVYTTNIQGFRSIYNIRIRVCMIWRGQSMYHTVVAYCYDLQKHHVFLWWPKSSFFTIGWLDLCIKFRPRNMEGTPPLMLCATKVRSSDPYTFTYTYVYTHTYTCTYTYTYTHLLAHIHTHTHTHIRTHTYTHAHTHTLTHTRTHTHVPGHHWRILTRAGDVKAKLKYALLADPSLAQKIRDDRDWYTDTHARARARAYTHTHTEISSVCVTKPCTLHPAPCTLNPKP